MSDAVISAQMESWGYQFSTGLRGAQPSLPHPINQPVQVSPWLWQTHGAGRAGSVCSWWGSTAGSAAGTESHCPLRKGISQGGLQGVLSCHQPLPTSSGTKGGPIRENHHMPEPAHGARTSISQRTHGYKLLGKENEGCWGLETHCGVTPEGWVAHVRAGTIKNNSRKKVRIKRIVVTAAKTNLHEYYPWHALLPTKKNFDGLGINQDKNEGNLSQQKVSVYGTVSCFFLSTLKSRSDVCVHKL